MLHEAAHAGSAFDAEVSDFAFDLPKRQSGEHNA